MFFPRLSDAQLQGLKSHKYSAQGTSLVEPVMQVYWRWLVTKVPLWVAPNLLTFVGLLIIMVTALPVMLLDRNCEGVAPSWSYIACAVGFFMYQSLDAIDGKQARRTDSANQLGELFDHGCDAISIFLVMMTGASSVGLQVYPLSLLVFIVLLGQLNFTYHWQTYVCGTLHFKLIDVTEAQFLSMSLLMIRGLWGMDFWQYELPVAGVPLRVVPIAGVIGFSLFNLLHAFSVILTSGVGKNGTTVANTSVISPVVSMLILAPVSFLYFSMSPSPLTSHCLLFISATCLPTVKIVIAIIIAGMTKTPYPLLDPIMLAPWLAVLNVFSGSPLPEVLVLLAVMVWELVDISVLCVSVCLQVADFLQVPIFSLPKSS